VEGYGKANLMPVA